MSKLESQTYILKYPVTIADASIKELIFSRPKIKHLKRMGEGNTEEEKLVLLVCAVTSQSELLINEIDLEDFAEIVKVVNDFLPKGLLDIGKI